MDWSVGKER